MVTAQEMDTRVYEAVRGAWSRLSADEIALVGQNLKRLAEALHQRYGFDDTLARYEAMATLATVATPSQTANAGWVEVMRSPDAEPIGRGQMLIHGRLPDLEECDLCGCIQHLRLRDGVSMPSGNYLVRFEPNGEVRPVAVIATSDGLESRRVGVAFMDCGLPITMRELSNGE